MDRRHGHNNRRTNSQLLPRLYMLFQIVILALVSYISFVILKSLGMNKFLIYTILGVANVYFAVNFFFRCKLILHRNRYINKFKD